MILFTNYAFYEEKSNCVHLKKFSIQYTWCKSKNAGEVVKNKLGSLTKNNSSKDSKN